MAQDTTRAKRLKEVAALFLKLGFTGFGGPAAHLALMHHEIVQRRGWLSDQEFLDLIGAVNLVPGPNSTEMAIHIGLRRAGWLGLILGGLCFILPAMGMVTLLAWAYVRFNALPQVSSLLYGIKPVIIAVIVQALWNLGRSALRSPLLLAVAAAVLAGYFLGFNEIALLFSGGILAMLALNLKRVAKPQAHTFLLPGLPALGVLAGQISSGVSFNLLLMFLTFLKIGAVLYGSGYVLLAFLRADFVVRFGWLNDQQLLDAIAIGQVTPGPLFTSATFVGYLLAGLPGALLATLGIFLPSFVIVALSSPWIPHMRQSPWLGSLLDGVNAAALGLMAAVTWQLGRASLTDAFTFLIALLALGLLLRFRINSTWLIASGALLGLLSTFWR